MWRERRRAACRQRGQGARGRGHRAGRAGQRKKKGPEIGGRVLDWYCMGTVRVATRLLQDNGTTSDTTRVQKGRKTSTIRTL